MTTASGTIIQRRVDEDGEIAETIDQAAEDAPVERAEFVPDEAPPRLHWKTIIATTVVVLVLALAAITTYELVADRTLDGSKGTTIGDTFGGHKGKPEAERQADGSDHEADRDRPHDDTDPDSHHADPERHGDDPDSDPHRDDRADGMNPVMAALTRPTPWKEAS